MSDQKKQGKTLIRYLWATALSFGIVALYAVIALNLSIFNPVSQALKDYSITDFYYQVLGLQTERDTSRIITIVDMTHLRTRSELGRALEKIESHDPKVLGLDMVFEYRKPEDPVGDSIIWAVAANDTSAVFAYKLIDDSFDGRQYRQTVNSFFADSVAGLKQAFINMPREIYGSIKRKLPVGCIVNGEMRPSMIKVLADQYADQEIVPLADRMLKINYLPMDFMVVSADSIDEYADYIEDHIVLFGATREEPDMHITPQGKIPGVKVLAFGIETMLKHVELTESPWWLTAIVSFIIVLLTKIFFDRWDDYAARRKNAFLRLALKASLVKGIIKFVWMAVLMYIGFILFARYNFSINFAWALSAIAFTGSAEDLYEVVSNSIIVRKK